MTLPIISGFNKVLIYDTDGYAMSVHSTTSVTSSVAASLAASVFVPANHNRLGATLFNESGTATLYVKLGSSISITDYTVKVLPGGYYEVPYAYTGVIEGLCSIANGTIRITELS